MFRGRVVVKSVVKVASTSSISRAFFVPTSAIIQNVINLPRVSIDFKSRSFMTSKVTCFAKRNVYVGNMPFEMDRAKVLSLLGDKVAGYTDLSIVVDKKNDRPRGFAYFEFETEEGAEAALSKLTASEVTFGGRILKFDLAVPPVDTKASAKSNNGGKCSLFIGNLDFTITEDQIMEMCDGILGPRMAQKARIAVDRETGRSKGFAHIDFNSFAESESALRDLNGVELLGRPLRIDHAARKEDSMNKNAAPALSPQRPAVKRATSYGDIHSIFLGNLSWDVTPELVEDMLNDVLGPGLFNQVRLAIDRETGRQRGFGHVDFINAETAARAVKELDGLEVMGRQLRADHAQQKETFTGAGSKHGRGSDNW